MGCAHVDEAPVVWMRLPIVTIDQHQPLLVECHHPPVTVEMQLQHSTSTVAAAAASIPPSPSPLPLLLLLPIRIFVRCGAMSDFARVALMGVDDDGPGAASRRRRGGCVAAGIYTAIMLCSSECVYAVCKKRSPGPAVASRKDGKARRCWPTPPQDLAARRKPRRLRRRQRGMTGQTR